MFVSVYRSYVIVIICGAVAVYFPTLTCAQGSELSLECLELSVDNVFEHFLKRDVILVLD